MHHTIAETRLDCSGHASGPSTSIETGTTRIMIRRRPRWVCRRNTMAVAMGPSNLLGKLQYYVRRGERRRFWQYILIKKC
uniref:Uncharacterized protein n=2 Tax=Hyaloperonospora arabidopsidis (strain Emoy2) TaxID=559515 RepID=M4BU90_HYAAE